MDIKIVSTFQYNNNTMKKGIFTFLLILTIDK